MKQGHWQSTSGTRLYGKTLGIYAFGNIGAAVARVGTRVRHEGGVLGPRGLDRARESGGLRGGGEPRGVLRERRRLSLHLLGGKETRGIVTAADLARMKPTALLVNTSRAPIIAEGALVAALEKGRPGFAAIDVYETEPVVGAAHPLLKMKNAMCTPHLGYCEDDGYEGIFGGAVTRLLAWIEGKPVDVINPEAIGKKK